MYTKHKIDDGKNVRKKIFFCENTHTHTRLTEFFSSVGCYYCCCCWCCWLVFCYFIRWWNEYTRIECERNRKYACFAFKHSQVTNVNSGLRLVCIQSSRPSIERESNSSCVVVYGIIHNPDSTNGKAAPAAAVTLAAATASTASNNITVLPMCIHNIPMRQPKRIVCHHKVECLTWFSAFKLSRSVSLFLSLLRARKTINAMKENRHRKRRRRTITITTTKQTRKHDAEKRPYEKRNKKVEWARAYRNQITLQDTSCFNTNTCEHSLSLGWMRAIAHTHSLTHSRWWWSTCNQKSIYEIKQFYKWHV